MGYKNIHEISNDTHVIMNEHGSVLICPKNGWYGYSFTQIIGYSPKYGKEMIGDLESTEWRPVRFKPKKTNPDNEIVESRICVN